MQPRYIQNNMEDPLRDRLNPDIGDRDQPNTYSIGGIGLCWPRKPHEVVGFMHAAACRYL